MGSKKRKEGLLLAVFWLAAVILIGTAANRLILHGPVGETLQKRETGWMLLELSVLFLWNLWWLCLAVKHRGKRKMEAVWTLAKDSSCAVCGDSGSLAVEKQRNFQQVCG